MKHIKKKDNGYRAMIERMCGVLEHCVRDGRVCPECGKVFVPDGKCERDAEELRKLLEVLK